MRKTAFTMVEALVVLGLTALIIGIAAPSLTQSKRVMAEQQFWRLLRRNWRQAQMRAELNHQATRIEHNSTAATIDFYWPGGIQQVKIPGTLKVRRFNNLRLTADGYMRAQTQFFYSDIDRCFYLMKIQLAWGGYRIEKKDETSFFDG